jgi:hypothetical protein
MRILTVLLALPLLASGDDSTQSGLNWLTGCWVTNDRSSQEVWTAEGDNSLLGFGVTIGDGEVVFYEILSIRQNSVGVWTYTAHPSGQASASFTAVEFSENNVVFANPDHDYPQQIRYWRKGNQLHATTALLDGKRTQSFDKIACE